MSIQSGKGGAADDEIYERLLRLKQQYAQARQELGPQISSFQVKSELPFSFNNLESSHESDSKDSKSKQRRSVRMRSRSDSACMFINDAKLQVLMRKVISQIGSCHVDTLLEYLRRNWELVRGGDMIPYNTSSCRKLVIQHLRNDTPIFVRDHDNEGCWTLSKEASENSDTKYYEPQIDCIMRAMEESETGECSLDYICAYVIKNWARRCPLSDTEIKETVKLILMTNPRFYYDTTVPGGLVYLRAKKNQCLPSANTSQQVDGKKEESQKGLPSNSNSGIDDTLTAASMTATIMGSLAAPSSPIASSAAMALSTFIFNNSAAAAGTDPQVAVAASELPTAHSEPNLKRPKRNRVASPPAGYACTCGATTPGKAPARWRKGPDGQFLCNACGLQLAKKAKGSKRKENGKHSGSERPSKRAKKTNGNEGAEEEDEDEEEEDSPWICCDACGEWVLAKDDNIEDVSIYDDSNPNHLDYFCPKCRHQAPETEVKEEETHSSRENDSTPNAEETSRWSWGEDNEGEESGMASSETTPHMGPSDTALIRTHPHHRNQNHKRGRTVSLFSDTEMGKRTIRPRAASQQHPSAADIMGETVSIGSEDKLDVAEQKIRLEWERMVSHQEGEEVDPEVSELEERFWNDIQKYKTLLSQTRDSLWSKNLVDYKKKKERLKREREKLDSKAESDLIRQFMEYFRRKKRKLIDKREVLVSQRTTQNSS